MRNIEHRLQSACVKWYRLQYRDNLLFAIPNGGARTAITGAMLKDEGVTAGVPDLLLCKARGEHHGLFIEMKTAKGVLSESQRQMHEDLRSQGYKVEVCRCFDEFKKLVTDYLHLKAL